MNRQEARALRTIEKNLSAEDPVLAELLGSSARTRHLWYYRIAGWLALVFAVMGAGLGDVSYLLFAGFLALGVSFGWSMQAVNDDELGRSRK